MSEIKQEQNLKNICLLGFLNTSFGSYSYAPFPIVYPIFLPLYTQTKCPSNQAPKSKHS